MNKQSTIKLSETAINYFPEKGFLNRHIFLWSLLIAAFILALFFFISHSKVFDHDQQINEIIEFVNVESIEEKQLVQEKQPESNKTDDNNFQKADNLKQKSIDLSFQMNIKVPKPLQKLKKIYPPLAKAQGLEATLYLEIIIDDKGIVRRVKVLKGKLSKILPLEAQKNMLVAFSRSAKKILLGSRFSRTEINGKYVPVITEYPFVFSLNI